MRKLFIAGMAASLLLLACNNDNTTTTDKKTDSTETKEVKKNTPSENLMSFKVNGEDVTTTAWNISEFDPGNGAGMSLNITSNMHEQPKTVDFNINGNKAGSYALGSGVEFMKSPGKAYGNYRRDYKNDMMNPYSFESGEFMIESIDLTKRTLNASFYGTATN